MSRKTDNFKSILSSVFAQSVDTSNGPRIYERGNMHLAAEMGLVDLVKELIGKGESVNGNDDLELSPLHQAVIKGHSDIIGLLLDAGADVNQCGKDMVTPLHLAAGTNQLHLLKRLVAVSGVRLDAEASDGTTALHCACAEGHAGVVKFLLASKANIESRSVKLDTPIHLAIEFLHFNVFKILVAAGADLFALNGMNCNCLHIAGIRDFSIAGVKTLIAKSVPIDGRDRLGASPLHHGAVFGRTKICQLLVSKGANVNAVDLFGVTSLHRLGLTSVSKNNEPYPTGDLVKRLEIARLLIQNGADVDLLCDSGESALHIAVICRELDIAVCLLDEGNADVNLERSSDRKTALHLAVTPFDVPFRSDLILALMARGANRNATDNDGFAPITCAVQCCNVNTVKLMLINGCFFDTLTINDHLPIHIAMMFENSGVHGILMLTSLFFKAVVQNNLLAVREFLEKGEFLIRCRSCHYKTSLHYPAWKGFDGMVKLLLSSGADPNTVNDEFAPPLFYAARFNHPNVAVALLKAGAFFDIIYAKNMKTPLMYAEMAKSDKVTPLLRTIEKLFNDVRSGTAKIKDLRLLKKSRDGRYSAAINARNSSGEKLIDVARKNKRNDVVAFLTLGIGG